MQVRSMINVLPSRVTVILPAGSLLLLVCRTLVFRMSRFLAVLRSWLMMVAIIAAGNTLQSFRDHSFLSDKLYTGKPGQGECEPRLLRHRHP